MEAGGIAVFDATPPRLRRGEAPRFLIQDTHWTPQWMETVAASLAAFVTHAAQLAPMQPRPSFRPVSMTVESYGDIVAMLKLPEDQRIFVPQSAEIRQVQDEDGTPWEPDPKGDVLLLGDSFTNVFSMESMGWGSSAGLAAHLALALGRSVDVIAQNDSGAFVTREALARELEQNGDRLSGKRAVIWEFASRELSVGNWKPVDWHAVTDGAR